MQVSSRLHSDRSCLVSSGPRNQQALRPLLIRTVRTPRSRIRTVSLAAQKPSGEGEDPQQQNSRNEDTGQASGPPPGQAHKDAAASDRRKSHQIIQREKQPANRSKAPFGSSDRLPGFDATGGASSFRDSDLATDGDHAPVRAQEAASESKPDIPEVAKPEPPKHRRKPEPPKPNKDVKPKETKKSEKKRLNEKEVGLLMTKGLSAWFMFGVVAVIGLVFFPFRAPELPRPSQVAHAVRSTLGLGTAPMEVDVDALQRAKRAVSSSSIAAANTDPSIFAMWQYRFDVTLEHHPWVSVLILVLASASWVYVGAFFWWLAAIRGWKRTALGRTPTFGNCLWAAWSCVAAASTHTKENNPVGRGLGLSLTLGGLFTYSLLVGAVSGLMRQKFEYIASGRDRRAIVEKGHVVVAGHNAHLRPLLQQLDRARMYARLDGRAAGKQTVLLLFDSHKPRPELPPASQLPQLNLLTRQGDIMDKESYVLAAASSAEKVVLLASNQDDYEADAGALSALLAVQPATARRAEGTRAGPEVVVEVSKPSSAQLLRSVGGAGAEPCENMTNKMLAQCMRQSGLTKVYRKLMRHTGTIINLRCYPELAGLPWSTLRRGFDEAVVCGYVRGAEGGEGRGVTNFHPGDDELYRADDKIMLVAPKRSHQVPPPILVEAAELMRRGEAMPEPMQAKFRPSAFAPAWRDALGPPADAGAASTADPDPSRASTGAHTSSSYSDGSNGWGLRRHEVRPERILICGWRVGVSETLVELDKSLDPGSEIVILAQTDITNRETVIHRKLGAMGQPEGFRNIKVAHVQGNPLSRTDVTAALLHELPEEPAHGGTAPVKRSWWRRWGRAAAPAAVPGQEGASLEVSTIVVVGDQEWDAGPSTDKRCIFSALLAEDVCNMHGIKPRSLVAELVDRRLGQQVHKYHPKFGYISSTELMGLFISQVVEHRDMNVVWEELLRYDGSEIYIKDPRFYTHLQLADAAKERGEVAIGWRIGERTRINPQKEDLLTFGPDDGLIVIAPDQY